MKFKLKGLFVVLYGLTFSSRPNAFLEGRRPALRARAKTILVLCILGSATLASVTQVSMVSAHFTLGRLTDSYRFHDQDFDPHVPGPTAYLWPGAGFSAITGTLNGLPPGYQTPWPNGNPPSAPSSWYQLEDTNYAPFGAILTSTPDHANIGDLILGINFTRPDLVVPPGVDVLYSGMYIYIPPDFGGIVPSQIVTTITNDYSQISVTIAAPTDPFAPGWTRVSVTSSSTGFIMSFRSSHDLNGDGVGYDDWYYVRLNGVVAPEVAGKYFFKTLLRMTGNLSYSYPSFSTPPTATNLYMPIQNWPVLLVKGEVDPAILSGTIRYGAWNNSLYGLPIPTSGVVRATGRSVDPYTGELGTRPVEARGFFNESAHGHYEVEGLAPGLYDVYASAAGFPEQKIASELLILKGQSMWVDGYLNPGPVISGQVFSKSVFGEVSWSGLKPIRIEIYATDTYTSGNLVSYSPSNMTGGQWGVFAAGNASGISYSWSPGFPPLPTRVGLTWDGGPSYYLNGRMFAASGPNCGGLPDPCGVPDGVGPAQFWWVDPSGMYTNGGGSASFVFRFGSKGVFGTPSNMSGYVPQALATWTNGLEPGRYFVRVFVNGYIQTTIDGLIFKEYFIDVARDEWAGDIFLPIDLYLTSVVNVTVHLHDLEGTLLPSPVTRPNSLLAELYDHDGNLVAMNFSVIPMGSSSPSVLLTGLGMHGSNPNRRYSLYAYRGFGFQDYGIPPGPYRLRVYVESFIQKDPEDVSVGIGFGIANFSVNVYRGASFALSLYSVDWEHPPIQRPWRWPGERITIQIFNAIGDLIDTQPFLTYLVQPSGIASAGPLFFDGNYAIVAWPGAEFLALLGTKPTAYSTGTYTFKVLTYGYIQTTLTDAFGLEGKTTDLRINLLIGTNITLNIKFKSEGIFSNTQFNMSMRMRVFNDMGDLVAVWLTGSADDVLNRMAVEAGLSQSPTNLAFARSLDPVRRDPLLVWYVPSGTTDLQITLAGIPSRYTDPVFSNSTAQGIKGYPMYVGTWTVEVDTVNWYLPTSFYPIASGLLQGESYHFIATEAYAYGWTGELLAGNHLGPYAQAERWIIPNAHLGSEISFVNSLDLNGYIQGQVVAMTWSDETRSASWIRIQATGDRLELVSYSLDGFFDMYLPPGAYSLSLSEWTSRSEGHRVVDPVKVQISPGQSVRGFSFVLEESGIPLSESPNILMLLLATTLLVLATKRKRSRSVAP